MTKAKPMTPKSQASTPKGNLKGVKNTPISKNKTPKSKMTPTGKVTLINGSPKGKGKQNIENNTPKVGKLNSSQLKTPKNKDQKGNGKTPEKNKQGASPQNKKNTPKGKSPLQKQGKAVKPSDDEEDDEDEEDINEGVQINEEVSDEEADSDAESESDDENGVLNILGNSLAEDSDEDDEDFDDEEEDDEEDTEAVKKGVKRFKGLKPSTEKSKNQKTVGQEEEEDDEDSSENDDDDDDEDSLNDSGPGLKALLGQSLADDDDDEDFSENDEEADDDDDISDDDEEEEEEGQNSPVKKQKILTTGNDEDDDEDEDEEEEDSEDEEDDTETSKLSALDESGTNDDDDDDDEEDDEDEDDEDDDEGTKSKNDSVEEALTPEEIADRNKRSIYVGNLPKDAKRDNLNNLFKKFGPIETIRLRGAVGKDFKTSKKLATIKRELMHPDVPMLHAYVRFKSEDSAKKAISMNGHVYNDFYLRVDSAVHDSAKPDSKKAVFLGNLSFKIGDNAIWKHFADCGKIISVRVVRDRNTGMSKGFGYINFENADSVALALKLNGTSVLDREIRVQSCSDQSESKKKHSPLGKKRPHQKSNQGGPPKRPRDENSTDPTEIATRNSQNAERRKNSPKQHQKRSQGEQQRQGGGNQKPGGRPGGGFQGQRADKNTKNKKFNKNDQKKKQVAAKFAGKPKKFTSD